MTIHYRLEDGIAWVTLDRPHALNSLDADMRQRLADIWRRIAATDDVRVMIMTAAGDRAFCTGADLKAPAEPVPAAVQATDMAGAHLLADFPWEVPSICAINGYALGGGLEIALACDIRIAADHAQLGLTEVRVGSIPGAGGTQLLPRVVGRSAALRIALTGERVDAAAALAMGMVSEVVPLVELHDRAGEIATAINRNAPLAVRAVKRLVSAADEVSFMHGLREERAMWGLLRDTEDRVEGRRAFAEKREPTYRGR